MRDNTPSHLRHVLGDKQAVEHDDEEQGLPALRDNEFRAYARPTHKPVFSIHFITPQGAVKSFQYMHLDSNSRFEPQRIALRFVGSVVMDVLIDGRNLWELYDYIHQHRMPWVKAAARDFAQDREPIVTRISVVEATDNAPIG